MPRNKIIEGEGRGGQRGAGGGGGVGGVGCWEISICYPELVISPIIGIGLNQINQQNKHAHTKE